MTGSSGRVDWWNCSCGKRGYRSKKDARLVARRAGHFDLSTFRCREVEDPETWHLGHLPGVVKRGTIAREDIAPGAIFWGQGTKPRKR